MNILACLLAIPITLALVSAAAPLRMRWLRPLVAAGLWVHVLVLGVRLRPLLEGPTRAIYISPNLEMDKLSALFILLTAAVMACAITHAHIYFLREEEEKDPPNPQLIRMLYACSSVFLLAMTMLFVCNNLGYMWIAIEATTLSSAPFVYYTRTKHALEATWKYLIICSVGIAFALLGTVLIFASGQHGAPSGGTLNIAQLIHDAPSLHPGLLRLGFIFCLLGFGTKAGMFPLHSWLPDAYSEAPAPASAMLSGALINCALFAIWRVSQIMVASHSGISQTMIVWAGAVTTLAAGIFLVRQHGFKRLWAYSSIENVGLMLVAIGIGSGSLFFLQALNHSLAKVSLFLLSGNVVQASKTKELSELRGIVKISPAWSVLLALSAFAVTGAPPFGSFLSEWLILTSAAGRGKYAVSGVLITAIALSFISVSIHLGRVLFGKPKTGVTAYRTKAASVVPALLVSCALLLGFITNPRYLVLP